MKNNSSFKALSIITIIIVYAIMYTSCMNTNTTSNPTELEKLSGKELGIPQKLPAFDPQSDVPAAPDYSKAESWLPLPDFYSTEKQPVDVFWVYPTILSDDSTYLMDTKDPALRAEANWTLVSQASVFDGLANVYAPYYRQNNVKINPIMLTDARPIFNLGQNDLIRAFEYFLEHFNKGERPVILAAHSQGSVRTLELAKAGELLCGDAESIKNIIAAYIIGYSITPEDLKANPLIKISQKADETSCFITYNSISDEPGKEKQGPTIREGSFVVNPLSWKTDTVFAPASENLGAVFYHKENPTQPTPYPHFAAAQKKGNALVVTEISNPDELPVSSVTFPKGIYHIFDYAIFYDNLKQNAKTRIDTYFNQPK